MRSTGSHQFVSFAHVLSLLLLVALVGSSFAAARVQDAPAAAAEPDLFSPIKATQLAHAAARDEHGRWAVHAPHHNVGGAASHVQPPLAPPSQQQQQQQHKQSAQHHEPPRLADHTQSHHHTPPLVSDSATLGETALDQVIRYTMWSGYKTYRGLAWASRMLIARPIMAAYRLTRYSAEGTWRTTTWAGDRAVWRPVRTVAAPLVYLVQGLLFLFVLTPYAVVRRLVRELYPVYVFLGAALALGTCMGIVSALVIYLGSFFFSDESALEGAITKQADEALPPPLTSKGRAKRRKENQRRWAKGESVLDQSIRELKRMRGQPDTPGHEAAPQAPSDEEHADEVDDYFGEAEVPRSSQKARSDYKGKGKERTSSSSGGSRKSSSGDSASYASQSSYAAPSSVSSYSAHSSEPQHYQQQQSYHTPHLGQLRMPVGATARGGWKGSGGSASSSPANSPVATLRRLPTGANVPRKDVPSDIYAHHAAAHAHALGGHSANSSPLASLSNTPLASPDFPRQPLPVGLKRRTHAGH